MNMEYREYVNEFIGLSKELMDKEAEIIRNYCYYGDNNVENTLKKETFLTNKWFQVKYKVENRIKSFLDDAKHMDSDNAKFIACLMLHVIDSIHLTMDNDVTLFIDKYRLPLEEILCSVSLELNHHSIYKRRMDKMIKDSRLAMEEWQWRKDNEEL